MFLRIRIADFKTAVVRMFSILSLISSFPRLLSIPLKTFQSAPSMIGITASFMFPSFFLFSGKIQVFVYLFAFSYFHFVVRWNKKTFHMVSSFFLLTQGLVFWPRLDDLFVSQNRREFYRSHFLRQMLAYAYTICPYDQILIFCTIPSRSLFSPLVFLLY